MNLDHLNYFKTLVELRSRSATAESLSITPSALSLALGKLEQEVGVPLIEKKRGAVELTSEGESFYEYVDASLRFLNNGRRSRYKVRPLLDPRGRPRCESFAPTCFPR